MKRIDLINRARRNLKQSRGRTILTSLAIAVGATTICLALAAGNGGRDMITKQMENSGISPRDMTVHAGGMNPETEEYDMFCAPEIEKLESLEQVEEVFFDSRYGTMTDEDGNETDCAYSVVVRAKHEGRSSIDETSIAISRTLEDLGFVTFFIQSEWDRREGTMQSINVAQWGLIGFGALAVLASIFGVINTQYISVLERTREIGLMRALGMRRRDIARLFRYEAAWIGFLGGLIGVVIAWLITLANPLFASFLELSDPSTRLLQINIFQALILIASLVIVAVLSGWFPARKAAKLDPVEALRTE
ncbi:FtsX-like permease family protein [Candidatus Saccharibacteria bacterium]|nr:FtsX-like permease family protein [Candidatus Saccharibacteria bacterium]